MQDKKLKLIYTINTMIDLCEPIKYSDFNKYLIAKDVKLLRQAEERNPYIGISKHDTPEEGVSILSIIATITDILVGDRLLFLLDNEDMIIGVTFSDD